VACASRHGRTQHEKTRLTSTARAKSRSNDRTKRENRRGTRQRGRVERHAHTQPRTDHQTRRSSETQNPVSSGGRRPRARAPAKPVHTLTPTLTSAVVVVVAAAADAGRRARTRTWRGGRERGSGRSQQLESRLGSSSSAERRSQLEQRGIKLRGG